jgi:hypothetical protein
MYIHYIQPGPDMTSTHTSCPWKSVRRSSRLWTLPKYRNSRYEIPNCGEKTVALHRGLPIPLAPRSKAWLCCRLLDGMAVSTSAGGMGVCLL